MTPPLSAVVQGSAQYEACQPSVPEKLASSPSKVYVIGAAVAEDAISTVAKRKSEAKRERRHI